MGKSKLALGKGLKELLPEKMVEEREGESLEEVKKELERLERRISSMGYSFPRVTSAVKKKDATLDELKGVLEEGRRYLISLNRLETVLKQMETLGLTAQAAMYRDRVSRGENPQEIFELAERDLKKEVLKKSRKKARDSGKEDLSEVQKMIDESREDIEALSFTDAAEAGVEAIKKIEELSKSLDELSRIMSSGLEEEMEDDEEVEEPTKEEVPETKEVQGDEDRIRWFLEQIASLKEEGFFVGDLELAYEEKGIEAAERELRDYLKRAERMRELKRELEEMDLTGVEREARLIKIKLKYPNLLGEVEDDIKRLKELKKKMESAGEGVSQAEIESAEYLISRAKKEYISGNLEKAKELFERVLKMEPNNPTAKFMLKRIKMRLG